MMFPFYKPDLCIGVADPLRPGAEVSYYPGEVVARMSDVIVINKIMLCKDTLTESIAFFNHYCVITAITDSR